MVTSVPAWFAGKARSLKPPGIDVTNIVDGSGSMDSYINFITSSELYVSLENALLAEGIGTLPESKNRYSFAKGIGPESGEVEVPVEIAVFPPVQKRWALGSEFLANLVTVPTAEFLGEDMPAAANYLAGFDRDYNPLNESIFIGGSDEQSGSAADYKFSRNPKYPFRYVGIHSIDMFVREGELPIPPWLQGDSFDGTNDDYRLNGYVYTTDTEGVGIYFNFKDGNQIVKYRDVPISALNAVAGCTSGGCSFQENIDEAQRTNGAIYDIRAFRDDDPAVAQRKFNALGESLGAVLGKLLYELA